MTSRAPGGRRGWSHRVHGSNGGVGGAEGLGTRTTSQTGACLLPPRVPLTCTHGLNSLAHPPGVNGALPAPPIPPPRPLTRRVQPLICQNPPTHTYGPLPFPPTTTIAPPPCQPHPRVWPRAAAAWTAAPGRPPSSSGPGRWWSPRGRKTWCRRLAGWEGVQGEGGGGRRQGGGRGTQSQSHGSVEPKSTATVAATAAGGGGGCDGGGGVDG
jgi:hypothetical protein